MPCRSPFNPAFSRYAAVSGRYGHTFSLTERDTNLWVYDKATGERCEILVGSNASGADDVPARRVTQYIVLPVGGGRNVPEELVAVGLRVASAHSVRLESAGRTCPATINLRVSMNGTGSIPSETASG